MTIGVPWNMKEIHKKIVVSISSFVKGIFCMKLWLRISNVVIKRGGEETFTRTPYSNTNTVYIVLTA